MFLLACVNHINIFIEVKYHVKTCILGGSVLDIYSVVTATFSVSRLYVKSAFVCCEKSQYETRCRNK